MAAPMLCLPLLFGAMGAAFQSPQLHVAAAGPAGGGGEEFTLLAHRDPAHIFVILAAIPFRDRCFAFFDHLGILLGLNADEAFFADDMAHLLRRTVTTEAAGTVNFRPSTAKSFSQTVSGASKVLWLWMSSPETILASSTL